MESFSNFMMEDKNNDQNSNAGSYENVYLNIIDGYNEWAKKNDEEDEMKYTYVFGDKKEYEFQFTSLAGLPDSWTGEFKKGFEKVSDDKEIKKVFSTLNSEVIKDFVSGAGDGLGETDVQAIRISLPNKKKEKLDLLKSFYKNVKINNFKKTSDRASFSKYSFRILRTN